MRSAGTKLEYHLLPQEPGNVVIPQEASWTSASCIEAGLAGALED